MNKLIYAIKMGYFTFKNPKIFQRGFMNMIKDIFNFIIITHKNKEPMATHMVINVGEGEHIDLVSLWCSVGADASPIKRLTELKAENDILNEKLKQYEQTK